MKAEERREEIVNRLSASKVPISAGTFSQLFGVSRQIIVKDIARLREDGFHIISGHDPASFERAVRLTE